MTVELFVSGEAGQVVAHAVLRQRAEAEGAVPAHLSQAAGLQLQALQHAAAA